MVRQIKIVALFIILISYAGCREVRERTGNRTANELHTDSLVGAACAGDVDGVKSQFESGADVNSKSQGGMTALLGAEACAHPDSPNAVAIVKYLIEKGAEVNVKGRDGMTPLLAAAVNGRSESIKALIARGADVNAKDEEGQTALMNAAATGCNTEALELLLEAGADINARNGEGERALEQAKRSAACPKAGIVQWLISNGAK